MRIPIIGIPSTEVGTDITRSYPTNARSPEMFTYRQASSRRWLAAVVPGRLVVWERGSHVVPSEIWSSLRDEGIGSVLLRFAGTDIYSCPPFALVEWSGTLADSSDVRVLLKGDYDFTAQTDSGPVSLTGEGKLTWLEHTLTGVGGFDIQCGEPVDTEEALPLGEGMAWVSGVSTGILEPADDDAQSQTGEENLTEDENTEGAAGAVEAAVPASDDDLASAPTVVVDQPQRDYEELFNAIRSAEESVDPAYSEREPELAHASLDSRPGHAPAVSAELKRLRSHGLLPRGGRLEASPYTFTITDRAPEPFEGVVLVGRSPNAGSAIGTDYPRLVTVDAGQDISRNHVQFAADHDELVVTDLQSRNGTIVVPPNGEPQRLSPGEPTVVIPGTMIDLGQGVTILLERE